MQEEVWVSDVLSFWFDDLTPKDWFVRCDTVDEKIRQRFSSLYEKLAHRPPFECAVSAKRALATIIVLDQFPRNIFRESSRAFATDKVAFELSERVIESGFDKQLPALERQFLYMPYQHAEDASAQVRSVELFAQLDMPDVLDFAVRHKEIIDRFGRFPHRNKILGRTSTQDELDFLDGPGSSF